MSNNQKKKLAVITGGIKGLGKATALQLCGHYDLALIYLKDSETANSTIKEIQSCSSNKVKAYQLDVSDFEAAERVHSQITTDFSTNISILVNAAGVALKGLFIMESLSDHRRSFEVNYFGAINLCKLVLPSMLKQKYGRIINLSSNSVSVNMRGSIAYCSSKAALEKFGLILGGEVVRSGVTVNTIRPGISETEMSHIFLNDLDEKNYQSMLQPSGQLINSSEIAKTVEFLIDSNQINSSIITVDTGHALFKKL